MESEYKLKYPVWIDGLSEYKLNHDKQKLLAYSSKCHTPIFGEPSKTGTAGQTNIQNPLSVLKTSGKNAKQHANETNKQSGARKGKIAAPKKKCPRINPLITRNIHCVPPQKKDMHCLMKSRKDELARYTPQTLTDYLRLLCNVNNVKPN